MSEHSKDSEVSALRVESLKLVVQAETLLGRLQTHQASLERFLDERRTNSAAEGQQP